ncbi:hypothetical protein WJX75_003635 [Coccomyxa subellipsoidea]|uniref:Uncharacterized protein n=1 Tax=Coccomyxa subellipsoidea TaxID=248742 RepID=A0ABR2YZV7_9CHLO
MQKVQDSLAERSKEQFKDCSRVLIFDSNLSTLYSTFQVSQADLLPLTDVFLDRDDAIRNGLTIDGIRYEASVLLLKI